MSKLAQKLSDLRFLGAANNAHMRSLISFIRRVFGVEQIEDVTDLPSVLTQEVASRTPDDVVEIIYLQKDTDHTFVATVRASFFVTVDEESGNGVHHGSPGTEVELAPGERAQVGDILGWEWDSVRKLNIEFRQAEDNKSCAMSYNLGGRGHIHHVAGLGEVCEFPPNLR